MMFFKQFSNGHANEGLSMFRARELLGLRRLDRTDESRTELRDKYFQLAKQCHPDSAEIGQKNGDKFALLSEAYVVLCNDPLDSHINHSKYHESMKVVWAKLFFGQLEADRTVSQDVVNGILDASSLSRGGLDKGGLWDFVDKFTAMHGTIATFDGSPSLELMQGNTQQHRGDRDNSSPKPFTRKRDKKTESV